VRDLTSKRQIHNLRNCDYRTETDESNCWTHRAVSLSDLRGKDLCFTTWGVRWIGHPILSFRCGNQILLKATMDKMLYDRGRPGF
jgi:hypothetical protein